MIHMEARVVATFVVTDPLAVAMNVRGFGVAWAVGSGMMLLVLGRRVAVHGSGSVGGNETAADSTSSMILAATVMLVTTVGLLRKCKGNGRHCQTSNGKGP
jgi:hypothetical protein